MKKETLIVYGDIVQQWVCEHIPGLAIRPPAQALGLWHDGGIVAGTLYEDFNGRSVVCHFAVAGRLTREFLWTVADYAFHQMGVHKVVAPVFSDNVRMTEIVRKMGFIEEARIKDAQPNGDIVLHTLVEKDCRLLGDSYNGKIRQSPANA